MSKRLPLLFKWVGRSVVGFEGLKVEPGHLSARQSAGSFSALYAISTAWNAKLSDSVGFSAAAGMLNRSDHGILQIDAEVICLCGRP